MGSGGEEEPLLCLLISLLDPDGLSASTRFQTEILGVQKPMSWTKDAAGASFPGLL